MIVCGLKLTHDGGVALIDGDRLICSVEIEKLHNNARYSPLDDLAVLPRILGSFGYAPEQIDRFVIDGWGGAELGVVSAESDGRRIYLPVAPYRERRPEESVLAPYEDHGLPIGGKTYSYSSYSHAAGHIAGSWFASPLAERERPVLVLVWDGGMLPRLYRFDPERRAVDNLGPLFDLYGNAYAIFAQRFGPFRRDEDEIRDDSSVAGKVMAYVALGTCREAVLDIIEGAHRDTDTGTMESAWAFSREVRRRVDECGGIDDEDVLASFHEYLQRLLGASLIRCCDALGADRPRSLIMAGGCALNIKWNSSVRDLGLFDGVWVPPFANDSGSALGTACCELLADPSFRSLSWSPYAGPSLGEARAEPGWGSEPMDTVGLAALLHHTGERVVCLTGRAEIGPRALGNRSILAPATSGSMKDGLNSVKGREAYRPVAPICLEEHAADVFAPGSADPYMLFDHRVRPEWCDRVPAIVHLDGTARLQTVNDDQNPVVTAVLREYHRLSGVPLLCNTSANLPGCGFFPDVASAMRWNRTRYVWSDDVLYTHLDG